MSESPAAAAAPDAGRISIAAALSRTFGVLFANIVPFLLLSFLLCTPVLVFNLAAGGGAAVTDPAAMGAWYALGMLISLIVSYVVMGTLVFGTVRELRGARAGLGECLLRGLSVFLPVLIVGILVTLLVAVGTLLLVIPGIVAIVMCAVAIPVAVVERPGIWASVKRSVALTKGNRWRVFGLILIFYLGFAMIGYALDLAGVPTFTPDGSNFAVFVQFAWSAITTAIYAVFGAVIYHDLRIAKEGATTEQIASVFD